jgi:hypothetical protein
VATRADLEKAERLLSAARARVAAFREKITELERGSGKRRERERSLLAAFIETENSMREHRDFIAALLRRRDG